MFGDSLLRRRVMRKQIAAVIISDPRPIIFSRWDNFVSDGAGGKVRATPVEVPMQIGKLIGNSAAVQLPLRTTEDGRTVQASLILVMDRKADVKQGDRFMNDGRVHEVIYVHGERSVATRCEVLVNG